MIDVIQIVLDHFRALTSRGLVRLDRSEPDIVLPLRNLPAHAHDADAVALDVSAFDGNLSAADTDVQKALDTLDELVVAGTAADILTVTTNFDGNLSAADDNVQKALETLDDAISVWMGSSLDDCYDFGDGPGAGRTIIADTGAVRITGDGLHTDILRFEEGSELTISSGIITPTKSYHSVDTESDNFEDYLDGITAMSAGSILILRPASSSRTVIIRSNQYPGESKNIILSGDNITLGNIDEHVPLLWNPTADSNGAWVPFSMNTASQVVAALENETGSIQLSSKRLIIGADDSPLAKQMYLEFGGEAVTNPVIFCNSKEYTNATEQMIGVESSGNSLIALNRNSNNKVTTWETILAETSQQIGIVRGGGLPNYLKSPVVCDPDDDEEFVFVAAYGDVGVPGTGDNSMTVIDITDKENPEVVANVLHNPSGGIYMDGISCVHYHDNKVYCTSIVSCSMLIFDVSTRMLPVLIGGVRGSTGGSIAQEYYNGSAWVASSDTNFLWGASWVEVQTIGAKKWAVVCSRMDGSVSVYDVTDPAAVTLESVDEHTNGGTTTDYHELAGAICCQIVYRSDSKWYVFVGTRWQNAQTNPTAGPDSNGRTGWNCEWHTGNRQGSIVSFELNGTTGALSFKDEIHGAGSPNYLSEVHGLRYFKDTGTYSHEYVYTASFGVDRITIIDVSDPTDMTFECSFGGSGSPNYTQGCVELEVVGNEDGDAYRIYPVSFFDNGFTIWNCLNASSTNVPTRIGGRAGSVTTDPYYLEDSHSIKSSGNGYLYITSRGGSNSLNIFSVEASLLFETTPDDEYTDATDLDAGNDLVVYDGFLYIPSYGVDKIHIVDLSDLTNLTQEGNIGGAGSPNYMDGITALVCGYIDIDIADVIVYCAYNDDSLGYVNINTPASPSLIAAVTSATYLNGAYDVDVDDRDNIARAYVACYAGNMLSIYSVGGGGAPTYINSVTGSGSVECYLGGARCIRYFDGYVIIGAKTDNAVSIYAVSAVSSTQAPERVAYFQGSGAPTYMGGVEDVDVDAAHEYAYVACRTDDAIVQIDISDPQSAFISGVLIGATSKLDGAIRVKCCTIHGYEFIIVGSWDSGSLVVLKKSDFTRSNTVGIRNSYGTIQIRHAFGSWEKLT